MANKCMNLVLLSVIVSHIYAHEMIGEDLNVYGEVLQTCSSSGMGLTGSCKHPGYCIGNSKSHICVDVNPGRSLYIPPETNDTSSGDSFCDYIDYLGRELIDDDDSNNPSSNDDDSLTLGEVLCRTDAEQEPVVRCHDDLYDNEGNIKEMVSEGEENIDTKEEEQISYCQVENYCIEEREFADYLQWVGDGGCNAAFRDGVIKCEAVNYRTLKAYGKRSYKEKYYNALQCIVDKCNIDDEVLKEVEWTQVETVVYTAYNMLMGNELSPDDDDDVSISATDVVSTQAIDAFNMEVENSLVSSDSSSSKPVESSSSSSSNNAIMESSFISIENSLNTIPSRAVPAESYNEYYDDIKEEYIAECAMIRRGAYIGFSALAFVVIITSLACYNLCYRRECRSIEKKVDRAVLEAAPYYVEDKLNSDDATISDTSSTVSPSTA